MNRNPSLSIRPAVPDDLSRIAEILAFVKRLNYRPIFRNDAYSFGELQVLSVAKEYGKPDILSHIWVYDDGVVKGLIHIEGIEVKELYTDCFFQSQGVGGQLLQFAIDRFRVQFLWVLEKNTRAIAFYRRHGFHPTSQRMLEEDTPEYLVRLERTPLER